MQEIFKLSELFLVAVSFLFSVSSDFFSNLFSISSGLPFISNLLYFSSRDNYLSDGLNLLLFFKSLEPTTSFSLYTSYTFFYLFPAILTLFNPITLIPKPYSLKIILGKFPLKCSLINSSLNSSIYEIFCL